MRYLKNILLLFTPLLVGALHAQPGANDPTFNPGLGAIPIYTTALQTDGKIVIGGAFFSYNGTPRSGIARVNADGSLDTSFDPGTGSVGQILCVALQPSGKIIIGGDFTGFNGTGAYKIARLNADGSVDFSFSQYEGPWLAGPIYVSGLARQPDGKIIVTGQFSHYGGLPRSGIARINADGSVDTSFDPEGGPGGGVSAIAVQPDGKIIIGGSLGSYNGIPRNKIARLNANGSLDLSFDPGVGPEPIWNGLWAVALQPDGKIIIGGSDFTSYSGIPRNKIARLNADGSLDTSFDPGTGFSGPVESLLLQPDGKIIAGGSFSTYNGTPRNGIARLNTDGSLDSGFNPGSGAGVATSALQPDGKIIITGGFSTYNGTPRNGIARVLGDAPDADGDGVPDDTDNCPNVVGQIGSSCDDINPNTISDLVNSSCVCTGTPIGSCDNWTLTFNLDPSPAQTTWQMVDATSNAVLASGGPYSTPNSTQTATICVPQGGCFKLTVNDSGNNGIAGGGWLLTDNTGKRIVDNVGNGGNFTSTSSSSSAFCNDPASAQTLIASHCDRENWLPTEVIIASANAAVSAQWGIGDQTDDGYQFWFENPLGGYSRRIFRDHATSGGNGPANAIRATKLKLSSMVTLPLPSNTLLNVRVRARVNGGYGAWGPVCRFKIDPNACTLTKLNDIVGDPNLSCGVTGKQVGASGQAGKIYAKVVYSGGNPATNYRFEFSEAGEGYLRTFTTTSAALLLSPWSTNPLLCGTYIYDVRVQASFDGGATYCPYGAVCGVEITNNAPHPCTAPFSGGGTDRAATIGEMEFAMYPNPNNGDQLFINMSELGESVSTVSMDMFDIFGQKVMTRTFTAQDGTMNTVIDLDDSMASGLYLVNITAGDVTRTERLMIQR